MNLLFNNFVCKVLLLTISLLGAPFCQTAHWIYYYSNLPAYQLDADSNFVWVRSQGMVRIDKETGEVEKFNSVNSSIPADDIGTITIEGNSDLWLGVDTRLARYKNNLWETIYSWYVPMLGGPNVRCITFDELNILWVGLDDRLCSFINYQINSTYLNSANLPAYINVIASEGAKKWIGTIDGMSLFENSTFTLFNTNNSGLPSNYINSIVVDNNYAKWIGTNSGLAYFNDTTWTVYNSTNSLLPSNEINSITIDNSNHIWIGTTEGLVEIGNEWKVYNKTNSNLSNNYINSVKADDENNIWIATGGGGIVKLKEQTWTAYSTSNSGLSSNWTHCIAFDNDHIKLIGTAAGLSVFDGINWLVFNKDNSPLPSNHISDIEVTGDGTVWLATGSYYESEGGLVKISNGNQWVIYTRFNSGLPHNYVTSVAEDIDGTIWIGNGMGHGLIHFDGTSWQIYNNQNSPLPYNTVVKIDIDNQGVKWILTSYSNLVRYDGNSWTIYTPTAGYFKDIKIDGYNYCWASVFNNSSCRIIKYDSGNFFSYITPGFIQNLSIDSQNNKWVGYFAVRFLGLSKFNDTTWSTFFIENEPLPQKWDSFIDTDHLGNKWVGNNGLIVFNENGVDTSFFEGIEKYTNIVILGSESYLHTYILSQNFPNPFNPITKIKYQIPEISFVTLKVYDVLGNEIATLVNEERPAGNYEVEFNSHSGKVRNLPSGIYFYRLQTERFAETKKMVLIK